MEHQQHFRHGIILNVPLLVATAREGDWIVCGGDDGFARVFDAKSGQLLHRLKHGSPKDLVQVVAVRILTLFNVLDCLTPYPRPIAKASLRPVFRMKGHLQFKFGQTFM
jgi:hypothetical protein